MSIIFYEEEHCKDILKNGVDKLTRRDLNYLAKYFDSLEYTEKEIERELLDFCVKNDGNFNEIQNYSFYHGAVVHARNNSLRVPTPIAITLSEIKEIQEIEDYKIQKFIFIMLVVAKFFKYHPSRKIIKNSKYDQFLYSNTGIKELKNLAHVNFSNTEWNKIKHDLTIMNIINPTIVGAKKWAIPFWEERSPVAILVEDYRNPIAYYQEYCGENMSNCIECNVRISKNSNRHSYCRSCWREHRLQKKREYEKIRYRKIKILDT
jgi:hypothetical protein